MSFSYSIEQEQIKKTLKPILWDYQIDPCDFFDVAIGKKVRTGTFDQAKALIRMLERLSWYDLVNLLGIDGLAELLTKEVISRIRIKELRDKYEFARKILHKETVSFSGWGPEYREKIKHRLLSDRWYRS
jgi:hypothetical protein